MKMACVVDAQRRMHSNYVRIADDFENSNTFQPTIELGIPATRQPNGFAEFVRSKWRCRAKMESR